MCLDVMAGFQHPVRFLLLAFLQLSGALIVDQDSHPIVARERDGIVTLPCKFTTTSGTPNITWFREQEGGRIIVMKCASNTLLAYDMFKNRVFHGDHGDLVLFKPTVEDSGNYTCEVEVEPETETPHWGSNGRVLQIKKETVNILPETKPITANLSQCVVILPCDFKTLSEAPRITWYHEKTGGRRKVMTYDNDRLEAFDEFRGRVARGDRGALVLLNPMSRDSGKYTCEVQEDTEKPNTANNTVELNITETHSTTTTPTPNESPSRPPSSVAQSAACIWSAFLILSLLGCTFFPGIDTAFCQLPEGVRNRIKTAMKMCQVVAFILIFIGTIISAIGLSSESCESNYWNRLALLCTSLLGMTLLLVMVCLMGKFSNNWPCLNSAATSNTSTTTTATSPSTVTTSTATVTNSPSTLTTPPTTVTNSTATINNLPGTVTTSTSNVTTSPTTTTSFPTTSGASSDIELSPLATGKISASSSDGTPSPVSSRPIVHSGIQESGESGKACPPRKADQAEDSGEITTVDTSCNDPLLEGVQQP